MILVTNAAHRMLYTTYTNWNTSNFSSFSLFENNIMKNIYSWECLQHAWTSATMIHVSLLSRQSVADDLFWFCCYLKICSKLWFKLLIKFSIEETKNPFFSSIFGYRSNQELPSQTLKLQWSKTFLLYLIKDSQKVMVELVY